MVAWMSITSLRSLTASSRGRWNALRPMMVPKPPPVADLPDLLEHLVDALGLAAGEDHDAPAVEGALHHVA